MTAPSQIEALVDRLRMAGDVHQMLSEGHRSLHRQAADMLTALSTPAPAPDEARAREVLAKHAGLSEIACSARYDYHSTSRQGLVVAAMLAFARECAAPPAWRTIDSAPKDGTAILVRLHDPLPVEGRPDLEPWHGLAFVARHTGVADDGFDIGWGFAGPVGQGGFPDNWMAGWMPLPAAPEESGTP